MKEEQKLVNTFVTIYSFQFESLISGFLKSVNEEEMILACVDTQGYNDGYLVMKTEDVYRMDYDSCYEKKLLDLYKIKQQKHEEIRSISKQTLLLWAYENKKLVTAGFEDDESEICGYLQNENMKEVMVVDKDRCSIDQGMSIINFEQADWVWIDEVRARDAECVLKARGLVND